MKHWGDQRACVYFYPEAFTSLAWEHVAGVFIRGQQLFTLTRALQKRAAAEMTNKSYTDPTSAVDDGKKERKVFWE